MKDKVYELVFSPEYDRYQRRLASMVFVFFDKKTGPGINVNEVLASKFKKLVIDKKIWQTKKLKQLLQILL